jgi:hypothetical protein
MELEHALVLTLEGVLDGHLVLVLAHVLVGRLEVELDVELGMVLAIELEPMLARE